LLFQVELVLRAVFLSRFYQAGSIPALD
jgi:hypothetical protein